MGNRNSVIDDLAKETKVNHDTLEEMLKSFKEINTQQAFESILSKQGHSKERANSIFKGLDRDGSGFVEFSELVVILIGKSEKNLPEKACTAFRLYDADNDGHLTSNEMASLFERVLKHQYPQASAQSIQNVSKSKVTQIIKESDKNESGRISEHEWMKWVSKEGQDVFEYLNIVDDTLLPFIDKKALEIRTVSSSSGTIITNTTTTTTIDTSSSGSIATTIMISSTVESGGHENTSHSNNQTISDHYSTTTTSTPTNHDESSTSTSKSSTSTSS